MADTSESDDLCDRTSVQLAADYRSGRLSPVAVVQACLDRIEERDAELGAFVLVDAETSLDQARDAEQRFTAGVPLGPLDGVPVAIKDLLLTAGWPTRRGSHTVDPNQEWTEDAPSVGRLRAGGAVLIGKTATPELGWKGVTDSPLAGVTRNPWNPERTAGGSSGGSSAAVAAGMAPLALGTDGGGSIRIPAAFSGIVGHKPTYGRVALHPPSPYGTLAHVGPMARTVADTALLLDAIAGPDDRDPTSFPSDPIGSVDDLVGSLDGLRVGWCLDQSVCSTQLAVATTFEDAVTWFGQQGATVEPLTIDLDGLLDVFETLWFAGAATAMAGSPSARGRLDIGLIEIADIGATIDAVTYLRAQEARTRFAVRVAALFAGPDAVDVIVTPTVPIVAFEAGREVPTGWPHRRWTTWTPWTWAANLTQQPAVSVPCGFDPEGLPIGLQVLAPRLADRRALAVAAAFEAGRSAA